MRWRKAVAGIAAGLSLLGLAACGEIKGEVAARTYQPYDVLYFSGYRTHYRTYTTTESYPGTCSTSTYSNGKTSTRSYPCTKTRTRSQRIPYTTYDYWTTTIPECFGLVVLVQKDEGTYPRKLCVRGAVWNSLKVGDVYDSEAYK
jgi:hypothetical protein